jgi:site-specific recombinase XerD
MQTLENYLQEKYSKTAITGYRYMINQYLAYIGVRAKKALYQDVLNYIGYLRTRQLHPKTLRNQLFAIKIYYRWLAATGQRKDHPCQDLNLHDKINRSIAVESLYSMKELEDFLEQYAPKQGLLKQRDKAIISLLIYQALGVLEISQLELNNIDLEKGTVYIKGNVKNKSRTLPLKPNQIMLLHKYITKTRVILLSRNKNPKHEDENALILTQTGHRILQHGISRQINHARASHQKLLPSKIRQSVIAHLLRQNNDLRIVQVFAGHRRAASTEEYKQTGLEELKTSIQKHHPLQ